MRDSEFRPGVLDTGEIMIEVFHKGVFVATVTPDTANGLRVFSKHKIKSSPIVETRPGLPGCLLVEFGS